MEESMPTISNLDWFLLLKLCRLRHYW